jgi:hypothetical protein
MKVVDIANEIYLENASPEDTSISAIAFWIRSNVGKLNTILYEDFSLDSSSFEILDGGGTEISYIAVAIMKAMYKVYRVELDIRANINAINNDSILAASDEGFSIRKVNRSEVLKTLTAFKKDTLTELTQLMHNYRSLNSMPSQVAGDDTEKGIYPHNYSAFERTY